MKTFRYGIVSALLLVLNVCQPVGAQFVAGNIVVERVNTLSSAASAVFVDQYTLATPNQPSAVSTVALPTTPSGGNLTLTDTGFLNSSGYLSRSVTGSLLVVSGYNASVGTLSVATTDPALTVSPPRRP